MCPSRGSFLAWGLGLRRFGSRCGSRLPGRGARSTGSGPLDRAGPDLDRADRLDGGHRALRRRAAAAIWAGMS